MLFEVEGALEKITPLKYQDINTKCGKNEKKLEDLLANLIKQDLFPEFLVFGQERSRQSEPDLFALDCEGNLVNFELKIRGEHDQDKIMQSMKYAQMFSKWNYEDMNSHYKKCYEKESNLELIDLFKQQFGDEIDKSDFNREQKIIVVSNSSNLTVNSATQYWQSQGIDIKEYFYRFYEIEGKSILELSSDLYLQNDSGHCWINTNRRYYPEEYLTMIKEQKAIVYGNRESLIDDKMADKYVFLYHNGEGIIAAGKGTRNI